VYATYFNSEIKVRTSAKRAEGVRSSKEMEEYKVLLVCKRDEVILDKVYQ
jgi:hypothetical protein